MRNRFGKTMVASTGALLLVAGSVVYAQKDNTNVGWVARENGVT